MPKADDLPVVLIAMSPAWVLLFIAIVFGKRKRIRNARVSLMLPAILGTVGYLFAVASLYHHPVRPKISELGDSTGWQALGWQLGWAIWGQALGAAMMGFGLCVRAVLSMVDTAEAKKERIEPERPTFE